MTTPKIIEKLSAELAKDLKNECQVVYILSLIVIVLEEENKKIDYPYIVFYRDWVMHNKLSRSNTVKLLLDIFKNDINSRISGHENARSLIKTNSRFFKLNTLKKEFVTFFKAHDLMPDLLNKNWSSLMKLLLEVIKEHPVEFNSEILKKLELTKKENGDYCYKFSLIGVKDKPIVKLKFK